MKKTICLLALLLGALLFAVSCTREPKKLTGAKPQDSLSIDVLDDETGTVTDSGITDGGANTEEGWGKLNPIN